MLTPCRLSGIADLFSTDVRWCAISPQGDVTAIHAEERAVVARSVPVRQATFAAGRLAARRLLLDFQIDRFALLPDSQRVPIWPPGIVGSISHSHQLCVVAIGPCSSLSALGVDTEPNEPLERDLWEQVCCPFELSSAGGLSTDELARHAKALFCVKEAVYKAWFVQTRQYVGFHDVHVETAAGSHADGTFRARVLARSPKWPSGKPFCGRVVTYGGNIIASTEVGI